MVKLLSTPPGARIHVDSESGIAPFSVERVVGINITLDIPETSQLIGTGMYRFGNWSNGGSKLQSLNVTTATTITANFARSGPPAGMSMLPLVVR